MPAISARFMGLGSCSEEPLIVSGAWNLVFCFFLHVLHVTSFVFKEP